MSKPFILWLCDACLAGDGGTCSTPGCSMIRRTAPDLRFAPEDITPIDEATARDLQAAHIGRLADTGHFETGIYAPREGVES